LMSCKDSACGAPPAEKPRMAAHEPA
jgi:hypothetical protein